MALEQGVGGTEFGQNFIVGHGELFFCPVRRPWRASGFKRRRFASRKIVLEMLEASGKRVYSAREIQPVRWMRGRLSGSGAGQAEIGGAWCRERGWQAV